MSASAQPQQGPPQQGQYQQGQYQQGQGAPRPDLHAALHLRPDQDQAWRAFQASTAPPQAQNDQLRSLYGRLSGARTPERLDVMAQVQQLQMANFNHNANALRRFYSALSPDQQRTFDQLTGPQANRQGAPR